MAVFIDGCFWHGCPQHHTVARTNAGFWSQKVRRNSERDAETTATLQAAGWLVVRIWEHEPPQVAADVIVSAVRGRSRDERPGRLDRGEP